MPPLSEAACYADRACQLTAPIVENVRLAEATWRVRIECPEIAGRVVPGQFVMIRLANFDDPLLGRALALWDVVDDRSGTPRFVDLVYLVVGKLTSRLAEMRAGQQLEIWGPLGNGFEPRPVEHLVMVAGGIGQTPFLALAREALGGRNYGDPPRSTGWAQQVTLCYGVRRRALAAGIDDLRRAGVDVQISSDDGSVGHHGLVTDLLARVLQQAAADSRPAPRVVCCGPEPMMAAVAELTRQQNVPCEVSLETPMACGMGICFSCVAKVRQSDGDWDYRRTCVEGPVFDANQILFD